MKNKSLALLLVTTFLVPSIANAGYGELSDASKGSIPDEIRSNPAKLKEWVDNTKNKFKERDETNSVVQDQVERCFASVLRKRAKDKESKKEVKKNRDRANA